MLARLSRPRFDGIDSRSIVGQVVTVSVEDTDVSGKVVTAQADFTAADAPTEP